MIAERILLGLAAVPVLALLTLWLVGERGHLFGLPSIRSAMRTKNNAATSGNAQRKLSILGMAHAYVYGRWTNTYIRVARAILPRRCDEDKRRWADHHHGKIMPTELAQAVITLDHDIPRTDLEQIIPYATARDLVLEGPPEITAFECACRHSSAEPCSPSLVCLIVGDGNFVRDHHPGRAKKLTQQDALDLLRDEHARGHVHTAYFKDVCDNGFYAICNCCKCCCGGIELMKRGVPMIASSGYVAQVDEALCAGCGTCEEACPFDAITVNGAAHISYEVCMGCGVCVGQCPDEAIRLARDPAKGVPLDVRMLGIGLPMSE